MRIVLIVLALLYFRWNMKKIFQYVAEVRRKNLSRPLRPFGKLRMRRGGGV